ncbi:hypothetical protein F9C07_2105993 [Aspergillus flavus]|uniref:Uncharacterized protein n=1 Tax=Aspergillus flavus (strain ATCC 200026 / FGSC A1120 / IAM 13836 / NRRL 3357 / JCM 12722 / SRRC 167) TaxID=332952 RepID=A0A7U2QZ69_ASPFN|nr:hypothetical protein F9C07_2105993 [Aspergillus flavus]
MSHSIRPRIRTCEILFAKGTAGLRWWFANFMPASAQDLIPNSLLVWAFSMQLMLVVEEFSSSVVVFRTSLNITTIDSWSYMLSLDMSHPRSSISKSTLASIVAEST